jgi:hypothetical protein
MNPNISAKIQILSDVIRYGIFVVFWAAFSPEASEETLEKNPRNRSRGVRYVDMIGRDLEAGDYVLNGETIILAGDGVILDGQHRLMAGVKSKKAFRSLVVIACGSAEEISAIIATIDRNKARTERDTMKIAHGYEDRLTTTSKVIAQLEAKEILSMQKLSIAELAEVAGRWSRDVHWAIQTIGHELDNPAGGKKENSGCAATWACFAFCRCLNVAAVDELAADVKAGNPANEMAIMIRNAIPNVKGPTAVRMQWIVKILHGIESYADGESLKRLHVGNAPRYVDKLADRVRDARAANETCAEAAQ